MNTVVRTSLLLSLILSFATMPSAVAEPREAEFFYALNVGGSAHTSKLGHAFIADPNKDNGLTLESVAGTQDETVFKTYVLGPQQYAVDLANGHYSVTLLFAEPSAKARDVRVFDIVIEDQVVSPDFDIVRQRDNAPRRALTRTVPSVHVTDGQLNIALQPKVGQPVLSGFMVSSVQEADNCGAVIWEDDFSGDALNPEHWNYAIWPAGRVNNELQIYTDSPRNVRTENGLLIIEAHSEEGPDAYSSARVHTAAKVDLLYGRVEARAKLPPGKGTWPAIWMMPTDKFKYATNCGGNARVDGNSKCDAWPNSGEIDIMEYVGYDPRRVHATVHTADYYWVNGNQRKGSVELPTAATEFHTYAVDWTPTRMDFSVDNVVYFTYIKDSERWQSWPFDHPFHVILNLAIGGGWGGAEGPPDQTAFPAQFQIDYVRMVDLNQCVK